MGLTHLLVALRGDRSSEILLTRLNAMTGLITTFALIFVVMPRAAVTHTDETALKIQVCFRFFVKYVRLSPRHRLS